MMAKHGFDGQAPAFRMARGTERKDPKTGEITREAEASPQNINIDRLEWLLSHKYIEEYQHKAGRKLQEHWELAQLTNYACLEGGSRGGSGVNTLPDVKCDALAAYGRAMKHMGNAGSRIILLVILENVSLSKAAAAMRIPNKGALSALHVALDALASHFGFA